MTTEAASSVERSLPALPCACANLRRAARAVTRMYGRELRSTGLEPTQYSLLMALNITGEITQGALGGLLALDTTTLTRVLALMRRHKWIGARPGRDRRERLIRLTASGRAKLRESTPYWERAQKKLHRDLGEPGWRQLGAFLGEVTRASLRE